MADKLKAEKLAAARKKLKEFQSRHNKSEATISNDQDLSSNVGKSATDDGNLNHNEHVANNSEPINMNFEALDPVPYSFNQNEHTESHNTDDLGQPFNWTTQSIHNLNTTSAVTTSALSQYFSNNNENTHQHQNNQPANNFIDQINLSNITETAASNNHSVIGGNPSNVYYNPLPVVQPSNMDKGLEQRNHELVSLLQVEKLRTHELGVRVTQQHAQIEALTVELAQIKGDKSNVEALNKLRAELDAHAQTIKILVSDKAELMSTVARQQQESNEYVTKCEELQGRLNASRHRVAELEKDLTVLDKSRKESSGSRQIGSSEFDTLQVDNKRLQKLYQDACDETTETQHQLVLKAREIEDLKNNLEEKVKELELVNLRVEQLTAGDLIRTDSTLQTEMEQKQAFERQIIELQNSVSELTSDRDRIEQQYQAYVQHLTKESNNLQQRVQELTIENTRLTGREESLLNHVSELERNFQKQINTQQRLAALKSDDKVGNESQKNAEKIGEAGKTLKEKIAQLEKENADLNSLLEANNEQQSLTQQQLLEKDTKLSEYLLSLERLQSETPDATNLLASIESDKIAASRAMAQNQELKMQLEEIQKAFVQLSNDKLELTTELQGVQYRSREVHNRFDTMELELSSIKENLHFKDEEMIRLTHENTELNKQILELTQELDKLRHYGATNNEKTVKALQQQLALAKQEIRHLKDLLNGSQNSKKPVEQENKELSSENDTIAERTVNAATPTPQELLDGTTTDQVVAQSDDTIESTASTENLAPFDNSDVVSVTSTINIATNEAMDKLQDRFKRTMNEIADLTEEKQRLEHLVMQLQSETETIGEYIALYQTQRRLLKQREIEKDIQLHRIAADREDMKSKLKQLNALVEQLLTQKGVPNAKQIMENLNNSPKQETDDKNVPNQCNGDHVDSLVPQPEPTETKEINALEVNNTDVSSLSADTSMPATTHETATKIINLLTEIKEKNLNQDFTTVPNTLHHCSCCSGKLEIV